MKKANKRDLANGPRDKSGRILIAPGYNYSHLKLPDSPVAIAKSSTGKPIKTNTTVLNRAERIPSGSLLNEVDFRPAGFPYLRDATTVRSLLRVGSDVSITSSRLWKKAHLGDNCTLVGVSGKHIKAGRLLKMGDGSTFKSITAGYGLNLEGQRINVNKVKAGNSTILKGTNASPAKISKVHLGKGATIARAMVDHLDAGPGLTLTDSHVQILKACEQVTITGKSLIDEVKNHQLSESTITGAEVELPEEMTFFECAINGAPLPDYSTFDNCTIDLLANQHAEDQVFSRSRIAGGVLRDCVLESCEISDVTTEDCEFSATRQAPIRMKNVFLAGAHKLEFDESVEFDGKNKTAVHVLIEGHNNLSTSSLPVPEGNGKLVCRNCQITVDGNHQALESAGDKVILEDSTLIMAPEDKSFGVVMRNVKRLNAATGELSHLMMESPDVTPEAEPGAEEETQGITTDSQKEITQAIGPAPPAGTAYHIDLPDKIETETTRMLQEAAESVGKAATKLNQETLKAKIQQHDNLADYDMSFDASEGGNG